MDLNKIALGLAANVNPIPELNPLDFMPDAIPEPMFAVGEMDITFDRTFGRGSDEAVITCRVLVSRADDKSGQQKLRDFMAGGGVNSVKAAIESDRTLDGACDDLHVRSARGNRLFVVGETRYYGVEFDVYVIGDGE
jgi:hypothetical protein